MGRNKGIALAWAALLLIIMIGIVGLSIDWGKCAWNVSQMQNAADAAALAGAHFVRYDQDRARDWAVKLGLANVADGTAVSLDRNDGNAEDGDVVLGRWSRALREFTPTTENPNACKVVVKRNSAATGKLKLVFGPGFGKKDAAASRPAIAISIASMGAGIICLSDDPSGYEGWQDNKGAGLVRDGGCDVDLRGPDGWIGDIQVNSTETDLPKPSIFTPNDAGGIWAGEITVCGTTNPLPDPENWEALQGNPDEPFDVYPKMPRIDDPLLAINDDPPQISSMTAYTCPDVSGGTTATIQPGWYPNGINPEGGIINMEPGVYAVGGGTRVNQPTGLVFNGGVLNGNGVMVYFTDGPGILMGKLDIGARAEVHLTSRGDAATPKQVNGEMGVVLWQDIDNHREARVVGTANSALVGTLYFPDAPLHLGGGTDQMGSQVLAGALHIHGNVTLGVAYDGRNFIRSQRSALVK